MFRPVRELFLDGANGNDAYDGLTLLTAKATIMGATGVASIWQDGDLIHIMPSTYTDNNVVVANQVHLQGHGRPLLQPAAAGHGIHFQAGADGASVSDIEIDQVNVVFTEGIRIDAGIRDITIERCLITGQSDAVRDLGGFGLIVRDCQLDSLWDLVYVRDAENFLVENCWGNSDSSIAGANNSWAVLADSDAKGQVIGCHFEVTRSDATAGSVGGLSGGQEVRVEKCSFLATNTNGVSTANSYGIQNDVGPDNLTVVETDLDVRTAGSGDTIGIDVTAAGCCQVSDSSIQTNPGSGGNEHIVAAANSEVNVINTKVDSSLVSSGAGTVNLNGYGSVTGAQREIFVDGINGNDANDGLSLTNAKATFTGASGADTIWQTGDLVHVMSATYAENVVINNVAITLLGHGTATIAPVGGDALTISGTGNDYCTLRNMRFSRRILTDTVPLTIEGCRLEASGTTVNLDARMDSGAHLIIRDSYLLGDSISVDLRFGVNDLVLIENCRLETNTPASTINSGLNILGSATSSVTIRDSNLDMTRTDAVLAGGCGNVHDVLNLAMENCHLNAVISNGGATQGLQAIETLAGSCYQIENCSIQTTQAGSGAEEHIVALANAEVNVINTKVDSSLVSSGAGTVNLNGGGGGASATAIAEAVAARVNLGTLYFVDGVSGAGGNDGRTRATAKATIAQALALAAEGDTVFILPATYAENVTITVDNLIMIGTDPAVTVIQPGTGIAVDVQATNVTIRGLAIDSPDDDALVHNSGDAMTVVACTITAVGANTGIDLTGADKDTISDSSISGSRLCIDASGATGTDILRCSVATGAPAGVANDVIGVLGGANQLNNLIEDCTIDATRGDAATSNVNHAVQNWSGTIKNCKLDVTLSNGGAAGNLNVVSSAASVETTIRDTQISSTQSGAGTNGHINVATGGAVTLINSVYSPSLVTDDGRFYTDRGRP